MNYGFCLLWFVALVVAIIFEARTNDVTAVWFMPAAAVACLLAFFIKEEDDFKNLALQVLVFVFVSIVSFIIFKISFSKKVKRQKKGKTNITALIGERCLVIEDISNINVKGLVNLKGSIWSACCADANDLIEAGTVVVVERVEGVKLVCSREK
jgi:membrane protein implicated in regulation of membrane protease activity